MMLRLVFAVVFGVFLATQARAACPALPPIGAPELGSSLGRVTEVCHDGYVAAVDETAHVPVWVAYVLTGEHTLGCFARKNNFHTDPALPAGSAAPADYDKTGYDKGHQAPAEDFDWSESEMSDSFSMANMAPQVPGLNRQQWERLEETVRAWAVARGTLYIYVGPVLSSAQRTIGKDKIVVPTGFWKVVVDGSTGEALAFYMDNKTIAKGDLHPQQTTVADVETQSGVKLPVKAADRTELWPADIAGWQKKHKAACGK